MPTMDFSELQALANLDFDSFIYLAANGNNRASDYYAKLQEEATSAGLANTVNYAILAQSVVDGSSLNGDAANMFTQAVANANGVDFAPESVNRLKMQYELMKADIAMRQTASETSTGELNYEQTDRIHATALDTIGLPPEAFSLHTPLTTLAKADPAKAQDAFEKVLSTPTGSDIIPDYIEKFLPTSFVEGYLGGAAQLLDSAGI